MHQGASRFRQVLDCAGAPALFGGSRLLQRVALVPSAERPVFHKRRHIFVLSDDLAVLPDDVLGVIFRWMIMVGKRRKEIAAAGK